MSDLVWLHEDALDANHPVFDGAGPGARAVFIWDDAYLQHMDYGFKRLVFIYESLLESNAEIVRGDLVDCLSRLARAHGGRIHVPETPNPRLRQVLGQLRGEFEIEIVAARPFVTLPREPDLRRFFRYWNKARGAAMSTGGGRE
jgi:hypothetical protein